MSYISNTLQMLREGVQLPKDILDKEGIETDDEVKSNEDEIEEVSTSAGVPGYLTPNAFGKNPDPEILGYKKVKKVKESSYMEISKSLFLEGTYSDYKKDTTLSAKQKVNKAIHEVNKRMFEIERVINQNLKLKQEMSVDTSQFWKSSKNKLYKISERLVRLAHKIKDLNA